MTMEVLDCEYSGTEHLMRLEKRPEVAGDAAIAENNATVTLYPATKMTYLHLSQFTVPPSIWKKKIPSHS